MDIRSHIAAIIIAASAQFSHFAMADSLVTTRGDVLIGQLEKLEAGIAFFVRGQSTFKVPLADVASLKMDGPFEIIFGDGERATGALVVDQGRWRLQSAYGELQLGRNEITSGGRPGNRSIDKSPAAKDSIYSVVGRGGAGDSAGSVSPKSGAGDTAVGSKDNQTTELSFLRSEALLLKDGKVEIDFGASYLRNERPLQSDRAFIGSINVRANLFRNLEGFVAIPLTWAERTVYLDRELIDRPLGLGDVRFGVKYRLFSQSASSIETILGLSILAPTGRAPYYQPAPSPPELENLINVSPITAAVVRDPRNPFRYPLGGGHWAGTLGVTLLRTFDPIILYAGMDYTHTFPATYFRTRIKPGDRIGVNLGLGFAVSERSTLSQQILFQSERPLTLDSQRLVRTGGHPVAMRMAYTHRLNSGDVVEPSILFGLTGNATNAIFALTYTKRF